MASAKNTESNNATPRVFDDGIKRRKPIRYAVNERGCWECTSHKKDDGYVRVSLLGKMVRLHRYSYEWHKGLIPEGLVIMHKCDNRACFNPDHLETGTQKENIHDLIRKGRGPQFKRGRIK